MTIENLSKKNQAKLRDLYSRGLTKLEWNNNQLVMSACKQLNIDATELRRRIAARMAGVYGI